MASTERRYAGKCIDCGASTELYEIDFENGKRVTRCVSCGLYHFYKKDFLGRWKLIKAKRDFPEL